MGGIPFRHLDKDRLSPLEEFLYEKYRLGIDNLEAPGVFPPSMEKLAAQYPEIAAGFYEFCHRVQNPKLVEGRFLSDDANIAIYSNLRYLPKNTHTHQFFEILFVLEGHCENEVEGSSLSLRKGDLCFIAPDVLHKVTANNHDVIAYNILVRSSTFENAFTNIYGNNDIVSDFFTKNLYRKSKETSPYILCNTDCEEILLSIFNQMIDELQNHRKFYGRYLNILFESFILELLRRHEAHFTIGKATDNVEHESITSIMRYIQSNYRDTSLSETARFFSCSEAHLSRMIKKFSGQNFSEIIRTIKLQQSARLLTETDMSISEIVEEVGYTDNSHLHKIFKQNYGMTPAQYKKQFGKNP